MPGRGGGGGRGGRGTVSVHRPRRQRDEVVRPRQVAHEHRAAAVEEVPELSTKELWEYVPEDDLGVVEDDVVG